MPRVNIELIEGRDIAQKRKVAAGVTQAIAEGFGVDPSAITIRFEEVPAYNMASGGVLSTERTAEASDS